MDDVSREVRRYLRYLRRYWWLLAAGAVLGVLGMFTLNRLSSGGEGLAIQNVVVIADRWRGMASSAEPGLLFAEDPEVLDVAVARLLQDSTLSEFDKRYGVERSDITLAVDGRRVLLNVRATEAAASEIARILVRLLDATRVNETRKPIELAVSAVETRLGAVTAELVAADGPTADALGAEAEQLRTQLELTRAASESVATGLRSQIISQTVDEGAVQVGGRFSPFLAVIGALAGIVFAAVGIIVWSVLDRRVATRRDVEAVMGQGSLLAVVPRAPSENDLRAAAAAVDHLRPEFPTLTLVPVGRTTAEVAASIASLTRTQCIDADEVLANGHGEGATFVPVAGSGDVTDAELERLRFVVERAGGGVAGVILVGGKNGVDLLD